MWQTRYDDPDKSRKVKREPKWEDDDEDDDDEDDSPASDESGDSDEDGDPSQSLAGVTIFVSGTMSIVRSCIFFVHSYVRCPVAAQRGFGRSRHATQAH